MIKSSLSYKLALRIKRVSSSSLYIYIYIYIQNVFFLIKPHLKHSFNAFLFFISDSKIRFSLLIIIILINHNIALLSFDLCLKKNKDANNKQ